MPAGRPRIYDRQNIMSKLLEWAKRPDSINLNEFCTTLEPEISPKKLCKWVKEDEEIGESYDIAKSYLASRRERWLNTEQLHVKAYDLNASNYDYFLREEKRAQAEFESSLRKEEDSKRPQTITLVANGISTGSSISEVSPSTISNSSH